MTDNEIIKALEDKTHKAEYSWVDSSYCDVEVSLLKNALDLINRQQAEVERLQKGNDELGKAIAGAYELNCFLEATRKIVRVEAIKEFAERLDKKTIATAEYCDVVLGQDIDNLVKEMVGK